MGPTLLEKEQSWQLDIGAVTSFVFVLYQGMGRRRCCFWGEKVGVSGKDCPFGLGCGIVSAGVPTVSLYKTDLEDRA